MTYEEALIIRDKLQSEVDRCDAVLKEYPRGNMGLTPDRVKLSLEFIVAKADFNIAFSKAQEFNAIFVKQFKREIKQERDNRRAKLCRKDHLYQ